MQGNFMSAVEKSIIQGLTTGLATGCYYGTGALAQVPVLGQTKLIYVAAVVGGAASLLNDAVHNFVKEEIHISKKAEDETSMVLGAGIGAIMYNFSLSAINPTLARDTGIWLNSAIGAGSELAGSFVYNLVRG